jgi:hypothetical protein
MTQQPQQPEQPQELLMPFLSATGSAAVWRGGVRVDEPEPHELEADTTSKEE